MTPHEQVKQFAEKHGKPISAKPGKSTVKQELKGKTNISRAELEKATLQMLRDFGYIE